MRDSRVKILALSLPLVLVGGAACWAATQLAPAPAITAVDGAPAGEGLKAAQAFVAGLTAEQKAVVVLAADDKRRPDWHFVPQHVRRGLRLRDLSEAQQKQALDVLKAFLSDVGYTKARTIMSLEEILHEVESAKGNGVNVRDPLRYYWTFYGEPTPTGTWSLSIEGHHMSFNYVVRDGKIVSHTPACYAVNPATVMGDFKSGPPKGTRVLKEEEELAFRLLATFEGETRKAVVIAPVCPKDIRGPAGPLPPKSEQAGLSVGKFDAEQKALLRSLIETYARNMPAAVAERELGKIDAAGWEKIYFAWAGADKPGIGHYYRVEGPTFLLEFVNVQPDVAGNPANHIHSVWRDPNGDFGIRVDTPHE